MPEIKTQSSENPEFARVIDVARLRDREPIPFDIAPTEPEARAIKELLDLQNLGKFRFAGQLSPSDDGSWTLKAQLGATVTQTCVVSLEPVRTRVDAPVRRIYVKGRHPAAIGAEVVVSPRDDEDVEPLGDRIDLGLVAIEALALALPAYPRRDEAYLQEMGLSGPDSEAPAEPELKPFSSLAVLREKLGDGS